MACLAPQRAMQVFLVLIDYKPNINHAQVIRLRLSRSNIGLGRPTLNFKKKS